MRRSALTGASLSPERALRFVLGPDLLVYADLERRLPGRGVWVEDDRASLQAAIARNSFARAFRSACRAPDGLLPQIEARAHAKCLEILGLARRAGALSLGFDGVAKSAQKRRPAILFAASDGSAPQRAKLAQSIGAIWGRPALVEDFNSRELAIALGRDRVIHASLADGRLADAWIAAYLRFLRISGAPSPLWAAGVEPTGGETGRIPYEDAAPEEDAVFEEGVVIDGGIAPGPPKRARVAVGSETVRNAAKARIGGKVETSGDAAD